MTREIGNSAPPSQYGGQKARNALKDAGAYNGDVRTEKKSNVRHFKERKVLKNILMHIWLNCGIISLNFTRRKRKNSFI